MGEKRVVECGLLLKDLPAKVMILYSQVPKHPPLIIGNNAW